MQKDISFKKGTVKIRPANCCEDIKLIVKDFLDSSDHPLPEKKDSSILIKPNLNNDLNALTGNSTDFRIIAGVLETLKEKGYTDITIADGANVGIDRRNINVYKRLRIDKLAKFYGVKLVNFNRDAYSSHRFPSGNIAVADLCTDADFFINIPKMKTHAEAIMSMAVKSLMGCVSGQQKRKMHLNLSENLVRINELVKPHLYIVDSIIAMEGNGPGDGLPKNIGLIASGTDPFLLDLVFAKLLGFVWREIVYLNIAYKKGYITDEDIELADSIAVAHNIQKAPNRSYLAEFSESRLLYWLKLIVRPLVNLRPITEFAYHLKIIQDIYSLEDDNIEEILWNPDLCGDNCNKCICCCPTDFEKIKSDAKNRPAGKKSRLSSSSLCIGCLYCYFVCHKGAVSLRGKQGFLQYHFEKYRNKTLDLYKSL